MSEVSIEKVVSDINGFRQRLAMLREELNRSNRAMADKMSQLGETLTQRVRDLRDQVTNAPQNLLALEQIHDRRHSRTRVQSNAGRISKPANQELAKHRRDQKPPADNEPVRGAPLIPKFCATKRNQWNGKTSISRPVDGSYLRQYQRLVPIDWEGQLPP